MTFKLFIITLCVCWTMADYNPTDLDTMDLGDVVRHTLNTDMPEFPLTSMAADEQGWSQMNDGCEEGLGNLYGPGTPSEDDPLAVYYTNAGQMTGLKVYVFGAGSSGFLDNYKTPGNAAQDNLVEKGYWNKESDQSWSISLSFRDSSEACSDGTLDLAVGDRIVINQMPGGVAKAIPMTSAEAESNDFTPGSCMAKMGQHWEYDVETAPEMSWVSGNLLPVVPMYHTTGPQAGSLNAVFVGTPVCQNGSGPRFDNVPIICALSESMMCQNWCDDGCKWDTDRFATLHIFFNSNPDDVVCENPVSCFSNPVGCMVGRECPANTANPDR